jgi:glycosyltransferase involved in cell wall biosynthesis
MKILIVNNSTIPVKLYGGTERVIWYLGKELVKLGHKVTYLVKKNSSCDFGDVIFMDETKDVLEQIPDNIDVIHFNFTPKNVENIKKPYLITIHGNGDNLEKFNVNTVFVSKNHANRHGSDAYVHNGLDWDDYSTPDLSAKRDAFHFLGNAAWRIKNVKGAIDVVKGTKSERLNVLGGVRFNVSMGLRFTFSPRINFYGMVGGAEKDGLLNRSKGLIFPVRWHEPFGLAITESLYFGCPVFGTPYGALPELVNNNVGFLSNKKAELINAVNNVESFSKQNCHDYAVETFNSRKMAVSYLALYDKVLSNEKLNKTQPELIQTQETKFLEWS